MTKDEFRQSIEGLYAHCDSLEQQLRDTREEISTLKENYALDAMRESGYRVGQPFTDNEGVLWYVSGVYVDCYGEGNVYLTFNFSKKDGTMSKVSGLGRGMPYIKIRG